MLKRLASSGLNFLVLGVSIAVFLGAFWALNGLATGKEPPLLKILAAAHDLNIGDRIAPSDLVEKTVYQDENAALYIPADQLDSVVGGVAALPVYAGQPLYRTAILATAAESYRLSAALAKYPGYSLFPLPLESTNIIAPDVHSFLPGDLVNVTLVINARPQSPPTATPASLLLPDSFEVTPVPILTPFSMVPLPGETEFDQALERSFPPLAKDLFPQGARVIAVQGLPPAPSATLSPNSSQTLLREATPARMLILLIPDAARESLALALARSDRLVVSLLARGEQEVTPGFTYWDFEDLFKADRAESLGLAPVELVATPQLQATCQSTAQP